MPPFSALDGKEPEQLWVFIADDEQQTGSEILAIPHNANVSNGHMFTLEKSSGEAIDANHSKTRVRWEPLKKITIGAKSLHSNQVMSAQKEYFFPLKIHRKKPLSLGSKWPQVMPPCRPLTIPERAYLLQ